MKIPHKLLAFAAVPLILALVACGGGSKSSATPTPASGGSGSQPAASGSSGGTAATGSRGAASGSSSANGGSDVGGDVLATLISNFANAKSWKAQIKDDSDAGANGTFEYVAPDKFHIAISGIEVISIGSDTYTNLTGTWTKTSNTGTGPLFDPNDLKNTIDSAKAAVVKKGGTDTVNGKQCQIYTYVDPDTSADTELCVANGLPQRIVEDDGDSKSTITFSDFNSNFDIKAPI